MASIFLSYDRDDLKQAQRVATALEKAGHSVWWDRHIKGGAQYSKEIEQALKSADAVVALWSHRSIDSAWVRDEAAAGRDTGRLVPLSIDGAEPPLGFRQFQTIDLSRWNGRGRLHDLLNAIDAIAGNQRDTLPSTQANSAPSSPGQKVYRISRTPLIAFAVAAMAGLALLIWQPWRERGDVPLVAVAAAEPNPAADALAADLLVKLGVLQSSHADTLQLVESGARDTPDFTFKVASVDNAGVAKANLLLVDNRGDILLWSREFVQPDGKQADLRQQMAYSAAQVLNCAMQALSTNDQKIKLPTLKLYLSGCADLSNLLAQDPRVAASIFVKVTEQAPRFKGAWKKLIIADIQALRSGSRSDQLLLRNLRNHIGQARRMDPEMAETFLAEAWIHPPRPIAGWMKLIDRAVAEDPDNPEILAFHSLALTNVGRMEEALADTRRAVEFNPLSPSARDALIVALLNSGQVEAARNELDQAEQLWPGATNVLQSRFAVEFRVGDPARALRMLQSGELGPIYSTNEAHESYLQARIDPSPEKKKLALASAHALYRQQPANSSWVYARALSEFGSHEELIDFLLKVDPGVANNSITWVLFRPSFAALHKDRRFMMIADRLGAMDFWRATGKWPDFCNRSGLPYDCKVEAAKLAA